MKDDRATILLKACLDFLNQYKESPYELEFLCKTVVYDDCECDGYCLINDICNYILDGE